MQLPASSFSYTRQNISATTSWLDHIVCSNPQLVSQMRILYGDTLQDHIPINCEITDLSINSGTISQDQHPDKLYIKFNNITTDQITLYCDNLYGSAIGIWADVLSCSLLCCDDPSYHRRLFYIYIYIYIYYIYIYIYRYIYIYMQCFN